MASTTLAFLCAAAPDLSAHGGIYRGPGDIVPPNPGGGRGTATGGGAPTPDRPGPHTPGPGLPSAPAPGNPNTGGLSSPTGGRQTPHTGGAPLEPDLTRWAFWWEFNKEPFIMLKSAIHSGLTTTGDDEINLLGSRRDLGRETLRPTARVVQNEILPALKRALEQSDNRDIVSSCMVALAKIGKDHPEFSILPIFQQHLTERDQEVRETAALAMGISQMPSALQPLSDLLRDNEAGRKLVDRAEVDPRTRSFAAYGLGLIANASSSTDLKRAAFEPLRETLEASHDRNIRVGCILGMRLIRTNPDGSDKESKLRDDVMSTLWTLYTASEGQGEQQIQAHVPAAIAAIVGRGGDSGAQFKERFAGELSDKFGKRNINIYQSAALALGQLCTPTNEDAKYSMLLDDYASNGRDQQTRYFALVALAQIGGDRNRTALLKRLAKGHDQEKSWAALALGVLAFRARDKNSEPDATIGRALLDVLRSEKNDEVLSAVAVGLGLCRYRDAADELRSLLGKYRRRDELAGYLCIGLALMEDFESRELIRDIAATSVRRPDLLKQAAIALGKLGDKEVTEDLTRRLAEPDKNVAKLSALAAALGYIGDRRTIQPLKAMLFDSSITELSRAFAAVALGGVADKEDLPWNTKIGVDLNYRAAVETLSNSVSGILDIL
ncbi:MAG: HEAT repeat domain-containing protein [Planctomycetota bacterium]